MMSNIKYKNDIRNACQVFSMYSDILNSYVLDVYVKNHYDDLPVSWRVFFSNITIEEIGYYIDGKNLTHVWPLSALSLRACLGGITIPRIPSNNDNLDEAIINNKQIEESCLTHPRLKNLFTKHVKHKKRHEIKHMADLCSKVAKQNDCSYIVDFGSGLGHLARVLAYGYGLQVCCMEAQETLSKQARKLDKELEVTASKHLSEFTMSQFRRPTHLNVKLTKDTDPDQLIQDIRYSFGLNKTEPFCFGLVGLHPCGDLAVFLINTFIKCPEVKFINIAGCCYMKISTITDSLESNFRGYPLSKFVSSIDNHELSYTSRELACHAIEIYAKRLRAGDYHDLQVHSYRAALEKIIVSHWPHLKHSGLKSVKHTNNLSFKQYCKLATENLGVIIPEDDIASEETAENLANWKKVVMFYSIRLMLAPLVETTILLDRLMFLKEQGTDCEIVPVFDPILSPRNHILTAVKKNNK